MLIYYEDIKAILKLWRPTLCVCFINSVSTENTAIPTAQVESSSIQNYLKFL